MRSKITFHTEHAMRGFTLVELVVVVLILGILAAVGVGKFIGVSEDANAARAQADLDAIRDVVETQAAATGKLPTSLEPEWFRGNQLPRNPWDDHGLPEIEIIRNDKWADPPGKVLTSASAAGYWYNAATGDVRARVPGQATRGESVSLYNRVNGTTFEAGDFLKEIPDGIESVKGTPVNGLPISGGS